MVKKDVKLSKKLFNFITETVNEFGFKINREKIKVMRPYQRQYVCGAVVNQKVNMQKSERHKLRAIVHNCELRTALKPKLLRVILTVDKFVSKTMGRLELVRSAES
jgi:predicted transcriptional regulator